MAPYQKRLPPKSGCCFEIEKIYFYMEYVKDGVMTPLEHSTGTEILCDRTERIVSTRGDAASGNYCTLLVSVCMNYSDPSILIQYEGYKHYLDIDEGENETMIEGKFNCSDRWSDEGGMLEFTVDGPGFVSPSRIASNDDWAVKFTSFEPGTANITVTFVSCGENPSQSPSRTISIECRETLGWFVDIQFEFLHEGEGVDWVFEDEVRIVADLKIVDEADSAVTGENIAGTHPETTVAADHCVLTAILAPDFTGGYLKGTKTGNEIQFQYAPDPATYFVLFGLHCERDPDPPFDIMVTSYANMEASIISQVLFTLPLVDGAWVEDYGEEDFGSSPAVQYWYSAQIGKSKSTE
jgi:hypothetical protein